MLVKVKPGSLILLSGPSASGKSCTAFREVVSSDELRKVFFGVDHIPHPNHELATGYRPRPLDDRFIFETMEQIVATRMRFGMTTCVDATLLTDRDRERFVKLAEKFNREYVVCIFNLPRETLIERDKKRLYPVGENVIDKQLNRFEKKSVYKHLVSDQFSFEYSVGIIPENIKLDVIGDIHGCYDELIDLLDTLGYKDLDHPDDRKLVFLGDYCDRGYKSLEVLDLVKLAVEKGHYAVIGNHDANLLKGLKGEDIKSYSTRETLHDALTKWSIDKRNQIVDFLSELPAYYLYKNIVFCHGDISYWSLDKPLNHYIYGESSLRRPIDTDSKWRLTSEKTLIRGHIAQTSEGERVIALEAGAGFGGNIKAIKLPEYQIYLSKTTPNYNNRRKDVLAVKFDDLVSKNLVKKDTLEGLSLYKYNSRAFFDYDCWSKYPVLKQARGVVLGLNGEPVSTVFPRTFNYLEQGAGKDLDRKTLVVIADKLNGFLCTTFLHPYLDNKVVITSSGSFKGTYQSMAEELIYKKGLYGRILKFLKNNPNTTLLWEAIHPDDVHPIPYNEGMHGVHLIGVGTNGFIEHESIRCQIAQNLDVPTPYYTICQFGEALELNKQSHGEGYMVRGYEGNYLMKLKSPVYLTTKLLQRIGEGKSKFMYSNPKEFKKSVNEELHFIIDEILNTLSLDQWLDLDAATRRDFVRSKIVQLIS